MSVEFDCDAELCKNWGLHLGPGQKTPAEIEEERREDIARRIRELEEKAKELETRIRDLEARGTDDGK